MSNSKGNRTWYSVSDNIKMADVQRTNSCKNCFLVSILKTKTNKGYNKHNYHLSPNWSLKFNEINVRKDQLEFSNILKDTLLQHQPTISIEYYIKSKFSKKRKKIVVTGTLLGMHSIATQDSQSDRKPHSFHLHIQFDNKRLVPSEFSNFTVKMSSNLLSDRSIRVQY